MFVEVDFLPMIFFFTVNSLLVQNVHSNGHVSDIKNPALIINLVI